MKIPYLSIFSLLVCFSGAPNLTHADVHFLPRVSNELFEATQDSMVHVQNAEVAFADFDALTRDFPFLETKSQEQIKAWILDEFAYISQAQLKLQGIRSTEIPVDLNKTKIAHRPHEYDRAVVLEAINEKGRLMGLVDIKGAGISPSCPKLHQTLETFEKAIHNYSRINELRLKPHSDGLMSLGEAVAEMTRQRALQMLFDLDRFNRNKESRYQTVETYFIISLPIRILKQDGQSIPAALYGRQPHFGRIYFGEGPSEIYVDDFGKIQQDFFGTAVDFGGVSLTHKSLTSDPSMSFGSPDSDPQDSNAWKWGHDAAEAFTRWNHPDKNAIYHHVKDMLSPIEEEWRTCLPQIKQHSHVNLRRAILFNLKSTNWKQQVSGLKALSALSNDKGQMKVKLWKELFKILTLKLKSSDSDILEARQAARVLAYYNGPKAHLLFLYALKHPDSLVQLFAQKAFVYYKGDNRLELMEQFLEFREHSFSWTKWFMNYLSPTPLCKNDSILSAVELIFKVENYQNVPSQELYPRVFEFYQRKMDKK